MRDNESLEIGENSRIIESYPKLTVNNTLRNWNTLKKEEMIMRI